MCGIAGIVRLSGNPPRSQDIRAMCDAIKHRGPDDEGYLVDGNVAMGNRRLSIIDLSLRGRQPIYNEDRTIAVVHNGEVYNYAEIRKELEGSGHVFVSDTDTEVIVHAYEEWGRDCVRRFNGMWGFAIFDKRTGALFMSRDRFGVKPFYYYHDEDRFLFCSEIKGILSQHIPIEVDKQSVFDYLLYHLLDHNDRTFFRGIRRLLPGHSMVMDLQSREIRTERWYLCNPAVSAGDPIERTRDLFTDSVRLRLIADVPVGSCLSGGIDSSSIVCMMRMLSPQHEIKTFSALFPGTKIDESRYAREVVERSRVQAFSVTPTSDDLLQDIMDLVRTQEEPFLGTSMYAQYRVMKLAHENGMKVLLDGQGNDEIFAGYDRYFGSYFHELLRNWRWLKMASEMCHYYRLSRTTIPFQAFGYLLLPDFVKNYARRIRFADWMDRGFYEEYSGQCDSEKQVRQCQDLNSILTESVCYSSIPQLLRYEDKNSMRWSIESRVPFLDYRLVEYVLSLPAEDKIRHGVTKYRFRQAMEGILPDGIRKRTDKIGFATPEDLWMRDAKVVAFMREVVNSESFERRGYWDAGRFRDRFERFVGGRAGETQEIWKVICLELWFREFMDQAHG